MREKSAVVVGGLVLLLTILPLGFLLHVSPRFPGSPWGTMIGIAGALLMLVPFAYLVVKRWRRPHDWVTRRVSMRTLLAIHIYAGVLGPILGLLHAAHKFNSPLAVSLTGMMVVVVVSGYIGRYLLAQISRAVRGRRADLAALHEAISLAPGEVPGTGKLGPASWVRTLFHHPVEEPSPPGPSPRRLAEAAADLEFAIRAESLVQRLFDHWLRLHIVIAMILYALLALHVWSGLYYGLRWL